MKNAFLLIISRKIITNFLMAVLALVNISVENSVSRSVIFKKGVFLRSY